MTKRGQLGCIGALLGVTFFVVLGGLIVYMVFTLTRPIVDASEEFLSLLGQGKITEAYDSAADGLRAQQNEGVLHGSRPASRPHRLRLGFPGSTAESRIWREARSGPSPTSRGEKPIALHLIWEAAKWKVASVRYGGIELTTIRAIIPVPPDTDLERLSVESLSKFHQAVRAKDFKSFYAGISNVWQKQTTPEQLQNTFQALIDKDVDLSAIKNVKPQFDPPGAVDESGVLKVAGHYPTQPIPLQFRLEYFQERGVWKLMGLRLTFDDDAAKGKKQPVGRRMDFAFGDWP